jgi:hypothetical protein
VIADAREPDRPASAGDRDRLCAAAFILTTLGGAAALEMKELVEGQGSPPDPAPRIRH